MNRSNRREKAHFPMLDSELSLGRVWRTVLPSGMCATERNMKKHNTGERSLHESRQYQEPTSLTTFQIRAIIFALLGAIITSSVLPTRAASWTTNSPMLVPRYDHTATRLQNGKVLVTGGETDICGATTGPTALAEIFNPSTSQWSLTGAMTTPRSGHTATLLSDGTVLVAGGSGNVAPTLLSSAELYYPEVQGQGGFWRAIAPMNFGRELHTATLLLNGKVLVAGGYGVAGSYYDSLASAELYDPLSHTWTNTGSMNSVRRHHSAVLLPNGKVLVAGGYASGNDINYTADLYDPSTGVWTTTAPVNTAQSGIRRMTLLPNGKALLTKGFEYVDPGWRPVGELYDFVSESWTVTGAMTYGGGYHSSTLLPDGNVLVAGGYGNAPGDGYQTTVDVFDPLTGNWSNTNGLLTARKNHTATLLTSGKVLVTGGYQGNCVVLASTEMFNSASQATPPTLTSPVRLPNGGFQLTFTNRYGAQFSVLTSSDPTQALNNWTTLGGTVEMLPGQFQFTDENSIFYSRRFYRVVSVP
jgi:N-acetylneuraminic acid mutarotase